MLTLLTVQRMITYSACGAGGRNVMLRFAKWLYHQGMARSLFHDCGPIATEGMLSGIAWLEVVSTTVGRSLPRVRVWLEV